MGLRYFWKIAGPFKVYVEGVGWIKPIPLIGAILLDPENTIVTEEEEKRLLEEYGKKKPKECNK